VTATRSDPKPAVGAVSPGHGTLPGLVLQQSVQRPKVVALRKKDHGIWKPMTWQGYLESMRSVGLALHALNIKSGDGVGIVAENEPAWLFADLGAQSIGALSVAAYPTQVAEEVVFVMSHSGCRVIFCGDQEQVDKIRDNRDSLPALEKIVAFDMQGVTEYHDPLIVSFADFIKSGDAIHASEPKLFLDLLSRINPDDVAIVGYTSGTTGRPKGAMLRHRDQVAMATALSEWVGMRPKDRDLCHFPLCHPAVRVMDAYTSLVSGNSVNFPESPGTVNTDIVELAPTFILGTPRVYELMKADVEIRIHRAAWIKRTAYRWARSVMTNVLDRKLAQKSRVYDISLRWLAHILVGRWVLERLGLAAIRYAACGGASVSPELLKFFWSFGVPVYETYGQSETSGVAFGQKDLSDLGTAGWIMPCIEARISDDGELMLRGDGIFVGYYNDQEQTAHALAPDGWYRTGDVGYFDDKGRMVITDRQKHVISNAGAKDLSPSEIENHLRLSPYISDVMVLGESRPYLSALVQIEYETVAEWAQRQNMPFTTFRSLAENPEVQQLLDAEVRKANQDLPAEKRVSAHRLLFRELDPDSGELTPTRKIKRDVVAARFADLIEDMYREDATAASSSAG
jgi:long-chain acyl-CoA synthetase